MKKSDALRRLYAGALTFALILCMLCGCGKDIKQELSRPSASGSGPAGEPSRDLPVERACKAAVNEVQNFSTLCLEEYAVVPDEMGGIYIETQNETGIPYVLIFRHGKLSVGIEQFMEEVVIPEAQEGYGSNLVSAEVKKQYKLAGRSFQAVELQYYVGEYLVVSNRLFVEYGGEVVSFNAKYLDGEGEETLEALALAIENLKLDDLRAGAGSGQGSGKTDTGKAVKVRKAESADVAFVTYSDPNGYFSVDIPKGWQVRVGMFGGAGCDLISYGIKIYDPENPERMAFLQLNDAPFVISEEGHKFYNKYYPGTPTAALGVCTDHTTKGYFGAADSLYGYNSFAVIQDLGGADNGTANLLLGKCISGSGIPIEGLFYAFVATMDMFPPLSTANCGFVTGYSIMMLRAPEEEFVDWLPVLDKSLSTLAFTDKFRSDRKAQWASVMGNASYISETADDIRGILSSAWESRNRTYDTISRKNSDAILGYERVYNTETGEIYRAYEGFSESYGGQEYQPVTEDMYAEPIAGYIEQ